MYTRADAGWVNLVSYPLDATGLNGLLVHVPPYPRKGLMQVATE
jgi:hypothetical protein